MPTVPNNKLIIILGLLAALGPLCVDMYIPGMLDVQGDLGATAADVQLTLSAFLIGYALGQLFYGPVSDRFGRKRVLLAGIFLFTVASMAAALAQNIESLILFRFLHALGGGAGMVLARAIIRDIYPAREVARLMSFLAIITMAGPMVSPIAGGYLVVWAGWQSILWLLTVLGGISFLVVAFAVPESHPHENRLKLSIVTTFTAYRQVVSDRQSFAYIACTGFSSGGIFAYISSSPFVFIQIYGLRTEYFGYVYAMVVFGVIVGAIINTRLVSRVGIDRMISYGLVARLAGIVMLLSLALSGIGGMYGVIFAIVFSMAPSIIINANAAAGVLHLFPKTAGTASAVIGAVMFGCGAVSGPIVGYFHNGTIIPMLAVFSICFTASAVCYWGFVRPAPAASR
jgi:DHA1 family bicyclomycin/chloramphenicol resistance-like MFS transporter